MAIVMARHCYCLVMESESESESESEVEPDGRVREVPWGPEGPWVRAALAAHLRVACPVAVGEKEAKLSSGKSAQAGY